MSAVKPRGRDRGMVLPLVMLAAFMGLALANPGRKSACGSCGFFLLPGGACPRPAPEAVVSADAGKSTDREAADARREEAVGVGATRNGAER